MQFRESPFLLLSLSGVPTTTTTKNTATTAMAESSEAISAAISAFRGTHLARSLAGASVSSSTTIVYGHVNRGQQALALTMTTSLSVRAAPAKTLSALVGPPNGGRRRRRGRRGRRVRALTTGIGREARSTCHADDDDDDDVAVQRRRDPSQGGARTQMTLIAGGTDADADASAAAASLATQA